MHKGSCHCGKVAFEVEGDIDSAMSCNCSICQRKGSLLWFVPATSCAWSRRTTNASHLHVQQARDQAPLLPGVRHPPLRRGRRSRGQPHGGRQHPLPRGRRPRRGSGQALRRPLEVPCQCHAQAINLARKLALFDEHWAPRVVAEMNDYQFKLVKLEGEFVWHRHEDTDEVFIVVAGEMEIGFRDGSVTVARRRDVRRSQGPRAHHARARASVTR